MAQAEESHLPDSLVPVSVWKLAQTQSAEERSVVILREDHGEGILPCAIGPCEAATIHNLLDERHSGRVSARPLTHELVESVISALGGRLERAVLTRLVHETFFAVLVIRAGAKEVSLDARPSDAISLALATGAPLYALRELLEDVSGEP